MAIISKITPPSGNEYDIRASAIPSGEVDSTSTSTVFTATVPGVTELTEGVCVFLRNGVVTSASGFTLDVNGLGAKPCYSNLATGNEGTRTAATRDTTIFNINYTMLFVYTELIYGVSGGAWICYRGYDANTNTIGYQLRTNSGNLEASDTGYRYRLWFTSADGTKWVPANTSTSTDATTSRTMNTRPINPFGPIVYNSTNGTVNSGARPGFGTLWQQYTLTIGYSYVVSLTAWGPVYVQCTPQTDGSAVMNAIVKALPTSNDGKIYIYLGMAYSTSSMELRTEHPVFYHDGNGIKLWTGTKIPSKTSDLTNDSGFITSAVTSVNGDTGDVTVVEGLEPLIGDVDNISPAQVRTAVLEGRDVSIAAIGQLMGVNLELKFTSFNCAKDVPASGAVINVVISQTIAYYNDVYYLFELVGGVGAGWNVLNTALAQLTDIPENISDLNNDVNYITTSCASSLTPVMDGTATQGVSNLYARGDHVHPTDTTRASTATFSTSVNGLVPKPSSASTNSYLNSCGTWTSPSSLPSVSASDNGKVLTVVNGVWAAASLPVYQGGIRQ